MTQRPGRFANAVYVERRVAYQAAWFRSDGEAWAAAYGEGIERAPDLDREVRGRMAYAIRWFGE